jgi:hypothetical protein
MLVIILIICLINQYILKLKLILYIINFYCLILILMENHFLIKFLMLL